MKITARYSRAAKIAAAAYLTLVLAGIVELFLRNNQADATSEFLIYATLPLGLLVSILVALEFNLLMPLREMAVLMFVTSSVINALVFLEFTRFIGRKKQPCPKPN